MIANVYCFFIVDVFAILCFDVVDVVQNRFERATLDGETVGVQFSESRAYGDAVFGVHFLCPDQQLWIRFAIDYDLSFIFSIDEVEQVFVIHPYVFSV
jgi:hypothetical protein